MTLRALGGRLAMDPETDRGYAFVPTEDDGVAGRDGRGSLSAGVPSVMNEKDQP